MAEEWRNWSGSLRFRPSRIEEPADEAALARRVREAMETGGTLRVVGAGHSSSPLVRTDDTLVSLTRFRHVYAHDIDRREATVGAGMVVGEAGAALFKRGLAMHNTGDVDVQTLAGAIGTGTHGTGRRLPNLATMLIGGRMVTGTGDVLDFGIERDPELVRAARVSLGAIGILTRLRLRLLPAYRLHRREWCARADDALGMVPGLMERHRNFDFYWYPRSDQVKLRTMDEPEHDPGPVPGARLVLDRSGWSHQILPRKRHLRFDEMEYLLPLESAPACFAEVRRRVKARWRRIVAWRVLVRTVAGDDAYLSPMHGAGAMAISLHQNAGLPFQEYFDDLEPLFLDHGGRPHWGKKHGLDAPRLAPLYPDWERARAWRERLDPRGVFMSPDLRRLLGGVEAER